MTNDVPRTTDVWLRVFVLLFVCSCAGCQKAEISKFISSDTRAYLEVTERNTRHQIFTEYQPQRLMAILVSDELNNPEVLKLSFPDHLNRQNTLTIEIRQQQDTPPLGAKLIEPVYIEALNRSEPEFTDWKRRFSSFPSSEPSLTNNFVVVNASSTGSTNGIRIVDGEVITLRIKDWLCHCREGGLAAQCVVSALRCAVDNLCDVWRNCVETGNWTPDCQTSVNKAKICLAQPQ